MRNLLEDLQQRRDNERSPAFSLDVRQVLLSLQPKLFLMLDLSLRGAWGIAELV